jgi:hypothetical protein
MPIAVFLWWIGWSLAWAGSKRKTAIPKPKLSVQKELIIFVPTPEQKYATSPKQIASCIVLKMVKNGSSFFVYSSL